MKSPFVSVIVIGYNIEKYIDNCIQTVIDQSYRNIEIIFVNDGSKDNTLDQVKEYTYDSRLKIVDKPNGGIVSARKAGVRESAGDYVAFIDGDDWLNTDMISRLCFYADKSRFAARYISGKNRGGVLYWGICIPFPDLV